MVRELSPLPAAGRSRSKKESSDPYDLLLVFADKRHFKLVSDHTFVEVCGEDILPEHSKTSFGKAFCLGQLSQKRDRGSAFDAGQKLCSVFAETKNPGILASAFFFVKGHVFCPNIQKDVEKAAADPGISHISCF